MFNHLIPRVTVSNTVLQKAKALCKEQKTEWVSVLYGTPSKPNGFVTEIHIEEIFVPNQVADSANCDMDKADRLAVIIQCSKLNLQVVGWLHSHSSMEPYLSDADNRNVQKAIESAPNSWFASIVVNNKNGMYSAVSGQLFSAYQVLTFQNEINVEGEGENVKDYSNWAKEQSEKIRPRVRMTCDNKKKRSSDDIQRIMDKEYGEELWEGYEDDDQTNDYGLDFFDASSSNDEALHQIYESMIASNSFVKTKGIKCPLCKSKNLLQDQGFLLCSDCLTSSKLV